MSFERSHSLCSTWRFVGSLLRFWSFNFLACLDMIIELMRSQSSKLSNAKRNQRTSSGASSKCNPAATISNGDDS
ncbi:hypothetical protein Ddc_13955 [Ditylenchus destructor]|nr:hypothetical protein Ddc_13955 [Ditylenchus destructor]